MLKFSLNTKGDASGQRDSTHLWEFIPHFFYLLPFLADDGSMKTLFNDQVLCTLVLLGGDEELQ